MSAAKRPEERFQEFLSSFQTETGEYKYKQRIAQMAASGLKSLLIDFEDLWFFDHEFAQNFISKPDEYIDYASEAVRLQMKVEEPVYAEGAKKFFARFRKLSGKISLRRIGSEHLRQFCMIDGIIVRASPVKPFIVEAVFRCRKTGCSATLPVKQSGLTMRGPGFCPHCGGRFFDIDEKQSVFINTQDLRVQERPEDLPPGQMPRFIDVKLYDDLVDVARPGDRISITGIVRAQQEVAARGGRLRTFDLYLEANFVDVAGKEVEVVEITPEEEKHILKLAEDQWIGRKLRGSIATSIYGYDDVKEAILYLVFGGVPKLLPDGITIRGDVNVLLIGDPGTAKSQLLQYVARIAPRGLYTSGRGSTAAGLTAAVLRDKTGGMVLEAGALVLADKGVCAIDEIDKMRPDDRVMIHEAMEQRTVSIAKGGIVATLNARAAVLAAANPALGRYDPFQNVTANINLPVTILSRFDLIFIIKDKPEADPDARMSDHILTLHRMKTPPEAAPIAPDLLRKYISYAKKINPVLSEDAAKELREYYLKMRSTTAAETPVAITPRQLEALVRLSEAKARSMLRSVVTAEDAAHAIRLMNVSLQDVGIDIKTGKVDIDTIMTGKPKSVRDRMQAVITEIVEMEKQTGMVEERALYETLSEKLDMSEAEARSIVGQLLKEGMLYQPSPGYIKRAAA